MQSPVNYEKLSSIAARLSSPFDGERAAAALLATRQLEAMGMTWPDVIRQAFEDKPKVEDWVSDRGVRQERLLWLLCNAKLNEWENDFVSGLWDQVFPLSEKQIACLEKILTKYMP